MKDSLDGVLENSTEAVFGLPLGVLSPASRGDVFVDRKTPDPLAFYDERRPDDAHVYDRTILAALLPLFAHNFFVLAASYDLRRLIGLACPGAMAVSRCLPDNVGAGIPKKALKRGVARLDPVIGVQNHHGERTAVQKSFEIGGMLDIKDMQLVDR